MRDPLRGQETHKVYHFFGLLLPKNKAIEKAAKAIIFHANTIANTA